MRMLGSEKYRLLRFGVPALASLVLLLGSGTARADSSARAKMPRVLSEPGEITNVIDAFDDDGSAPDVHFTLGYQHTWKSANIRRETYINNPANPGLSSGGFIADTMNVARYSEATSRLNTRVDFGIYKDFALFLRMPIILSNDRQLEDLNGSARQQDITLQGAPGERLFSLPFKSPQRSGIEYLALGFDLGIMNQMRDPSKPTWIIGFESRFSVSEPMRACTDNPPSLGSDSSQRQPRCAYPADINRSGRAGDEGRPEGASSLEGHFQGGRTPGISRGTTTLMGRTLMSKRIKYVEPYGGFSAAVEIPNASSDYSGIDVQGSLVNHPPVEGSFTLGLQVIPYENREEFQRITFDFRAHGTYRSEGRDYSELFDALGSSTAPSLRNPIYAGYHRAEANGPSVVNPNSQKVYFTGLTNVQAHGKINLSTSVTWQAAEYIKFQLGFGYTHVQAHLITADQPCNPSFADNPGASGPCSISQDLASNRKKVTATGLPNPNFRASIDTVGRRFKADDVNLFDAWLNAVVMF